ncbi:hypothetical protein V0288_06975 [Pannus brasiliensis CCIBt3594]|uniref:Uncharacterized protein n=1 Tax=Pannus brasiliensis CCIBt3594 TaxID=1427578 RepID=A0AAW9QIF1_9CHRO
MGLGSVSDLRFSNGTTSPASISSSGFTGTFSNLVPKNNPLPNALLGTRPIKNEGDTTAATVTLAGLTPNGRYDLYAYTGYYSALFSVGSISGTATGEGFAENNPLNWIEGRQYAKLSSIAADNSGSLTLTVAGITPNPIGIGTVGLFLTGKRRGRKR